MRYALPFSSVRRESMEKVFFLLSEVVKPIIMEVGRTRFADGMQGDGYSTIHFADYVQRHGGMLLSVDADPGTEKLCRELFGVLELDGAPVVFVDVKPESFHVPEADLNLLYLDGPDCTEGMERQSAQWHLACMKFLEHKVVKGGLVLVDDCMNDLFPEGKGSLAIPYLVEREYEVLYKGYQWLLRKTKETQ